MKISPQNIADEMEKAASAIDYLQKEAAEIKEEKEQLEKRAKTSDKLLKLAAKGKIDVEDVPDLIEKYASMDDEDYKVEMKVLEKTAKSDFINDGELSKKASGSTGNPFIDLVVNESGMY